MMAFVCNSALKAKIPRHLKRFRRCGLLKCNEVCKISCSSFSSHNLVPPPPAQREYDLVVVGGGIVGMATARELQMRHPDLKMAVVEKESMLGKHQSGHNSGVVHGGIYYKPGSLKAKLCVEGLELSYKYFDEKRIPYKRCGKLIVALNASDEEKLAVLYERSLKNKVPGVEIVDSQKIKEIEPYCKGTKGLWSPYTGIVDWQLVTNYYGKDFLDCGGEIHLSFKVVGIEEVAENPQGPNKHPVRLVGQNYPLKASYVVTCGGLQSDKLAQLSGGSIHPKIIPFRGEYLLLNPQKQHMINGNIYPVPDARYPFLGVHFTPRMDGSVWIGPNAVLAFKREGYRWRDINLPELLETATYRGFQKMAFKNLGFGLSEMLKSVFISLQIKDIQKYIPDIQAADVRRGPAGVRAQAMDEDGNLVEDFIFEIGDKGINKRVLHCRNAPSPGATSSLAIAKTIAEEAEKKFQFK